MRILALAICNFNPLPRKEGDIFLLILRCWNTYFNPLPRKEGDLLCRNYTKSTVTNFNPLPRKEGDAPEPLHVLDVLLFQSTPS